MFSGRRDVHLNDSGRCLGFRRTCHHYHDVRVVSEGVDIRGEMRVAHFHALELGVGLEAGDLKLFDDV